MTAIDDFRDETRAWLAENCPPGARRRGPSFDGVHADSKDADTLSWLERMSEKGWTAPMWPTEYGGGGLSFAENRVLTRELRRIDARFPLIGIAAHVIGSTLLELGTEAQKRRHLPPIARAQRAWCQGYSEPGAGSDLASLQTRAEDRGDHFVINGRKIWTSGAHSADWMYALVRTDADAPKHEGISFVLLDMHQPGIAVRPIRLISGDSLFCETTFDDAVARKEDLIGELNEGWTVGKRLLQHERAAVAFYGGAGNPEASGATLPAVAREYAGEANGRVADSTLRRDIIAHSMNDQAFRLTRRRASEEARGGTPGPATSIFKMYATELEQTKASLLISMRGTQGLGWSGTGFDQPSIEGTRNWLWSRAASIYSGSNEIQRNIIAKRVLGLPD